MISRPPIISKQPSDFVKSILVALLVIGNAFTQDEPGGKSIDQWVEQLGADRVRLRDEAEDYLREATDAHDALVALTESSKNEEAVLRAQNILRHLKSHRWQLVGIRRGHTELTEGNILQRGLVAAPNGNRLYSRARDYVREWNAKSYEPQQTFGGESWNFSQFWMTDGFCRSLAVSPNSRMILTTTEQGEIVIHNANPLKELTRFAPEEAAPFIESGKPFEEGFVLSAFFMPDHKHVVVGTRLGVQMWNIEKKKLMWTSEFREPAFSIVLSPDRKRIIACGDPPRSNDPLYVISAANGKTLSEFELSTRLGGLTFDAEGKRLLGFGRDGYSWVFDYSESGGVTNGKSYGPIGKATQGAIWGHDQTTILTTGWNPRQAMIEWDLETGEAIWKAPPIEVGLSTVTWIDSDRIAALGASGVLTFWKYRGD